MEISLVQGILIGLITTFCYSRQLSGIYTNHALVMSFFVDAVLDDIPTVLTFGALAELAYTGLGVGIGGTVPPNPVGPGIVGTTMAIMPKHQGVASESALALSFPFIVLFQLVAATVYTIFSGNVKQSKNAIEQGKYICLNLIADPACIAFAVAGLMTGLLVALSCPELQVLVEALSSWLINGFSVASGSTPAIGFTMVISAMLGKSLTPYAPLGYIYAAHLELPMMTAAMVETVFTLTQHYGKDKTIAGKRSIKDESQTILMEKEGSNSGTQDTKTKPKRLHGGSTTVIFATERF